MRNDPQAAWGQDVRMVRKTKERRPIWYAKEWLAKKGLRQTDLVARTTYNKGQVSEYLSGDRRWNEDVLAAFAHAIGVEPSDLLRPPVEVENDVAAYVMRMDGKKRARALKVLKAMEDEEPAKVAG